MWIDSCLICTKVLWQNSEICCSCIQSLGDGELLYRKQGELEIFSLFYYSQFTRELIHRCKGGAHPYLSRKLTSLLMVKFLKAVMGNFSGVIPIPSSKGVIEDHAYLMGQAVSQGLQIPFFPGVLQTDMHETSQKNKDVMTRAQINLRLATACPTADKGVLIIVDDVITTGFTLLEAHKTLSMRPAVSLTLASRPYNLLNT